MKPLRDKIGNENCKLCKLHKDVETVCLIGEGAYPTDIAIISDSPGYSDDENGRPLSGKLGKLILDPLLNTLDVDRDEIFITNAIHCKSSTKEIKSDHIKACRKWLMLEMSWVKPKKIIVMGKIAAMALLDKYNISIKAVVGKKQTIEFPWGEAEVQFTYHPSFIRKKPYMKKYFKEHFARFISDRKRIPTIVRPFNVSNFFDSYGKKISIDIEDPNEVINSISVTATKGYGYWMDKSQFNEVHSILKRASLIMGHNLKHDLKKMIKDGLIPRSILYKDKLFDTLIGWNIIDENCFDKSLKYLSYNYTSMEAYERPKADEWDNLDIVRPYNAKDVDATKRLYNKEMKEFEKNPNLLVPVKIDMRVLAVLIDIELRGIKVDRKEMKRVDKALGIKLEDIEKDLGDIKGTKSISRKKLSDKLIKMGFKLENTEKGNPKTDKKTLEDLIAKEDNSKRVKFLSGVIEHGRLNKLKSTFIEGILNELGDDSIFYPTYFIAKREEGGEDQEGGTVTGRLSAKRFQQIPRDKETLEPEYNPRRLFTVRDPDNWLISADFSQVEMVVAGVIYDEPLLIEMYDSGEDIHTMVAAEVGGCKVKNVTKDMRKAAKTVNFGLIYGQSAFGLAFRLGWSEEKALRYIKKYFKRLPGLQAGIDRRKRFIIRNGYSETYFHRRRRLPGATFQTSIGRELIRQGVNSAVQGTAADICKICMYTLWQTYKEEGIGWLLGNVHDETINEAIGDKNREVMIEHLIETYKRPDFKDYGVNDFPIPLRGELKIGKNWFKAEKQIKF